MTCKKRLIPWLMAPLLLGACTSVHNPDLSDKRIPAEKIVGLTPRGSVTLTNGADRSAGNRRLTELGFEKIDGDLWKWTESAIDLARRELEARGGDTNGGGENELILEVSHVELEQGQWSLRATVSLEVEYGGGRIKTFTANVGSSRSSVVALDGALRIAVAKMLSDRDIQQHL